MANTEKVPLGAWRSSTGQSKCSPEYAALRGVPCDYVFVDESDVADPAQVAQAAQVAEPDAARIKTPGIVCSRCGHPSVIIDGDGAAVRPSGLFDRDFGPDVVGFALPEWVEGTCAKAIELYGGRSHVIKAIEEIGECIAALARAASRQLPIPAGGSEQHLLAGEIADAMLILMSLRDMTGLRRVGASRRRIEAHGRFSVVVHAEDYRIALELMEQNRTALFTRCASHLASCVNGLSVWAARDAECWPPVADLIDSALEQLLLVRLVGVHQSCVDAEFLYKLDRLICRMDATVRAQLHQQLAEHPESQEEQK